MGVLRRRKAGDDGGRRFQMRERMLAIGDDYWIEDEDGARAFLVDGKAMRVRDIWVMKDADGNEVAEIKERKLSVRDKMVIELGSRKATVTKRIVGIRDHFKVEVDDGADFKVHGNIVDHEYKIEQSGNTVAEISKKWFRVRDTYGVDVSAGQDAVLMLAITVAVDGMTRDVG